MGCGPIVSGWGIGEKWGKYRQWEARCGPLPFAYVSMSPSAAPTLLGFIRKRLSPAMRAVKVATTNLHQRSYGLPE